MTPARLHVIKDHFERALDLPVDQRSALLDALRLQEAELAEEVQSLLDAHDRTGLDPGSPVVDALRRAATEAADPWSGARVGVYQVVRRIGVGGMGSVYEAARADEEYRKRVAIKFLHRYTDDDAIRRRFRSERQILANLNHPNIASLLDGGVTNDGQPYIVMEYVEGEPITRWADQRGLSVRDRLLLFLQVCRAVQYAHQSLVVHRDLKPGNILVSSDGQVKLLDFGIAKLLAADEGSDQPTLTVADTRAYTPDYASPEQVLGQPVGTRSDVYALGVVLFELLTGRRPFDLRGKGAVEIERLISETSPTKPSIALVESRAEALGERSPRRARARLEGDLDAIVLTALRKEPERRYSSVDALAGDVGHYLDGLPVTARPDGFAYRFRKLVRRHRAEAAALGLAVLFLVGGLVATALKAREAERERALVTEVKGFLTTMLVAADPASLGRDVTMRAVLDSAAVRADTLRQRPELEAEIRSIIGGTYLSLGEFAAAERQFSAALAARRRVVPEDDRETALAMVQVAAALELEGRYGEADSVHRLALTVYPLDRDEGIAAANYADSRGRILIRLGKMDEALPLLTRALELYQRFAPENDSVLAYAHANLGVVNGELGYDARAESLLVIAVDKARRAHGEVHPLVAAVLSPLAGMRERTASFELADSTFRATITMRRQLLGTEHPEYAWTLYTYADFLLRAGRYQDAARLTREVVALRDRSLGDAHPLVAASMAVLGRALDQLDSLAVGERWLQESLTLRKTHLPENHWLIASSESILGEHMTRAGRYTEAEQRLLASERRLVELRGESAPIVVDARTRLVDLYQAWGKPEQAAQWQAKRAQAAKGPGA
ncbi:MAG: serine/threonine-protein kinase [Gemmatimonadales bacterium]